jgi:hypothetical protein
MKKSIIAVSLLVLIGKAVAQDAMYSELSQRDNDPFVFCTQGMKRPDPCWIPLEPYGYGIWTYTWLCDEPNTETGRAWTSAERQGLKDYVLVCSAARSNGAWDKKAGPRPENVPNPH